jgi:hypothetical protein
MHRRNAAPRATNPLDTNTSLQFCHATYEETPARCHDEYLLALQRAPFATPELEKTVQLEITRL